MLQAQTYPCLMASSLSDWHRSLHLLQKRELGAGRCGRLRKGTGKWKELDGKIAKAADLSLGACTVDTRLKTAEVATLSVKKLSEACD